MSAQADRRDQVVGAMFADLDWREIMETEARAFNDFDLFSRWNIWTREQRRDMMLTTYERLVLDRDGNLHVEYRRPVPEGIAWAEQWQAWVEGEVPRIPLAQRGGAREQMLAVIRSLLAVRRYYEREVGLLAERRKRVKRTRDFPPLDDLQWLEPFAAYDRTPFVGPNEDYGGDYLKDHGEEDDLPAAGLGAAEDTPLRVPQEYEIEPLAIGMLDELARLPAIEETTKSKRKS